MADAMLDTMPVPPEMRTDRRLRVALTPDDRDAARSVLASVGLAEAHSLLAVNLGATRLQKRWFAASFAAALDDLEDISCVLIGAGADDAALADEVRALTKCAKPVNLVGRTGVKQLAALLERCDVLLTADSGPMHLATAVGTPTVALFGSTDPAVTGPYDNASRVLYKNLPCAPCGNHPTCEGRFDCMREISSAEAALAVREVIRGGRRAGRILPMMDVAVCPTASRAAVPRTVTAPRVLIVTKFRFIGDTLLAIPIFRAARAQWPDARLTLLTGRNARVLLQNNPYLDEIIEFDPNRRDAGPGPFGRLLRRLRRDHFDLCLTLNRSFHSALIPWLAGVRTRAGFCSEGRSFLLNRRVPYEYDGDQSEIACYFEVLHSVAPTVPVQPALELWISPDEERDAADRLRQAFGEEIARRRLIGIQPGASVEGKQWPVNRFAQVAEALLEDDPEARLVLLGGPDERRIGTAMWDGLSPGTRARTADFVGALDLRGSLGLVSRLGLFLGNDTAIMHSAVALGVPTVALFGPTNPRKWGNFGPQHHVLESMDRKMAGLPYSEVLTAVRDLRSQAEPCMASAISGIIQDT
jgi:heptosyltransferase-2